MKIAVIGAGAMGSAIGATLVRRGAQVLTPLEGRSDASRARARAANMRGATWAECGACDFVLSLVPSSQAMAVARTFAATLASTPAASASRPVFLECNPIDPERARAIAALFAPTRALVVDAAIVGGPPAADGSLGPLLYVSGPEAERALPLADFGLAIERLFAPIGGASALKLAIAGISKGTTALLAIMMSHAREHGVADAWLAQLTRSNPDLAAWGRRQVPRLGATAGRWVEEMQELQVLVAGTPGACEMFGGVEAFFAFLAGTDGGEATASLAAAFSPGEP